MPRRARVLLPGATLHLIQRECLEHGLVEQIRSATNGNYVLGHPPSGARFAR